MMMSIVRDHIPLEQGLRQLACDTLIHLLIVRDHIPLEQGLRLRPCAAYPGGAFVRDHIPLEQGLRPNRDLGSFLGSASQRPYSIRTRIKTVRLDV